MGPPWPHGAKMASPGVNKSHGENYADKWEYMRMIWQISRGDFGRKFLNIRNIDIF